MRIGTSGFSYTAWRGSFYPKDLAEAQMLPYYAARFPAVEINNTFYRMPSEKTLAAWAEQVPVTFRFALKLSQKITHFSRLKDVGELLGYFLKTASVLGERLGPTLVQLPPNFKKDLARLTAFLDLVPPAYRTAFEFRHVSWFDEETYAALRSRGAALCLAEDEDLETPAVATAGWGYVRLRKPDYDDAALAAWAARLGGLGWSDAYVFFKHEDEGKGPALAARLGALLKAGG